MRKFYYNIPFIIGVSFCFLIYYSHFNSSIVGNDNILSKIARDFTPQGWGFFTRNCKEYQFNYYVNGKMIDLDIGKLSDLFGVKRISRFKARELSFLTNSSSEKLKWQKNKDSCKVYLIRISKYKLNSIDTGIYTIVKYKPIPWAWYKITNQSENPKKFLKVKLTFK